MLSTSRRLSGPDHLGSFEDHRRRGADARADELVGRTIAGTNLYAGPDDFCGRLRQADHELDAVTAVVQRAAVRNLLVIATSENGRIASWSRRPTARLSERRGSETRDGTTLGRRTGAPVRRKGEAARSLLRSTRLCPQSRRSSGPECVVAGPTVSQRAAGILCWGGVRRRRPLRVARS